MLKVFIDDGTGEKDYTGYVLNQSISIQRTLNAPSLCTLVLTNADDAFKLPPQRCYLRIYSTKYQCSLFTGFMNNDPGRSFLGMGKVNSYGGQLFNFTAQFTSDEYLLNIKSVPIIPAFVNQTQGSILRTIAEALCPGFYDFTYCASGDIVPYLKYDQTQSWSEIAKKFADSSRYRYSAIDKQIHFQPYGDDSLGIAYDEDMGQGSFDPFKLSTSAMTTPIVNDVTIVGTQEAGNNREDYFIGDGFTGAFPLRHKAFGLATAQQGNSILLGDDWSGTQLNTQNWQAQDPSSNFFYGTNGSSALNILTGTNQIKGTSFIAANNGLELAGGLSLQHGEVVFNDVSWGIIGGVYDAEVLASFGVYALDETKCETGFQVQPTQTVTVTASGAAGISIKPFRLGTNPDKSFEVITQVNKSYVLSTRIIAPAASRYNQVYRTMAGVAFGGNTNANTNTQTMLGSITWSIVETDLFTGVQTTYTFTAANQLLPQTAVYALLDNYRLNITLTTTYLTAPIPGSLNATCKIGAGLLAPIYVSGHVQYTGAFVTPSGGNLPIFPKDFGPENNFALGTSLQNQAAELDSGQVTDTLNFYSDDLPGVGVRVRLQTWESQSAISRVRYSPSIAKESAVVGDDGVRASIVSNLSPLPRTSEDCDAAAQAFIADRVNTFYQGTYNASWYFFNQQSDTIDYFPVCGRYLYVNSPRRNITKQDFLVTAVTTTVTDMAGERIDHNLTFGPDFFLDKLLSALVPEPTTLLAPVDSVIAPTPQELATLGAAYLPDVMQTTIAAPISGEQFILSLRDGVPLGARYEIRNSNINWGINDSRLIATAIATGDILLSRNAYDQSWFVRFTQILTDGTIVASRRTKALRIYYPQVPAVPAYVRADSANLYFDFAGDVRNIEGIELRDGTDSQVYYQAIVGSAFDMDLQLSILRGQLTPGQASTGPIGQFQTALVPPTQRYFTAHFFNLMWEYSGGRSVYVPPPSPPNLSEGYRFASALEIRVQPTDPVLRQDIDHTLLQVANNSSFADSAVLIQIQQVGVPGTFLTTVPVTGDLYARALLVDQISSGAWSPTLHIPQGNLVASDYLIGQGSIPPSVTTAAGGIFTYTSATIQILGIWRAVFDLYSSNFNIKWPNGTTTTVPPSHQYFNQAVGIPTQFIQPSTPYGFFPSLTNPSGNPQLEFNGPYLNYTDASLPALAGQFSDGSVPLTNGPFVCMAAASGSTGGGGGGGTGGGGNCGEISRRILCADGIRRQLKDIRIGERIITLSGRVSEVAYKQILLENTYAYITKSGLTTESALGHVLYAQSKWQALGTLLDATIPFALKTDNAEEDEVVEIIEGDTPRYICKIELHPCDPNNVTDDDHVYNLDGFWTHNVIVKVGI